MRKRLLVIITAFALSVLVGACAPPLTEEEAPTPTPFPTPVVPDKPVYEVKSGEVVDSVDFLCRVGPVREEELFFKMDGRVAAVSVEKGDSVKKGDVLAELEVQDIVNQSEQARVELEKAQLALEQAVAQTAEQLTTAQSNLEIAQSNLATAQANQEYDIAQAQINLENAQLRLQQARSEDPTLAVREAEAGLEKARIALNQAQIAYADAAKDPGSSTAAAEAYQQALIDYDLAQARYDSAVASQGDNVYNIALLENAVREADLALQRAQAGVDPLLQKQVESAQREVDRLQTGVDPAYQKNVETAQLSLDRIQAQVDSARIIAPFDGEVMGVLVFEGREAAAYKPVIIVAEPDAIELSCDLTSSVLEKLVEGMTANVVFSDFPGESLTGEVRRLPYPYGGGANVSSDVEQQDKSTRISLNNANGRGLEIGQLAKVNVILERRENALFLPPQAIRTFEGRRFVVVQAEDGSQQRLDVKIGIVSRDRVEITEGVKEGMVVFGP